MATPSQTTTDAPSESPQMVPTPVDTSAAASYVSGSRPVSGQLWPRLGH